MSGRPYTPSRWLGERNSHFRSWHLLVNVLAASPLVDEVTRRRIYRGCGMRCDARVAPGCFFWGPQISIGPHTWVNHRCYFDNRGPIAIGERCGLGMEVMFCTHTHDLGPSTQRIGLDFRMAGITVGDGAWIGTRVLLLPGVTVGAGCVVASGAVVHRDCAPDGLYAGVPARRVRDL